MFVGAISCPWIWPACWCHLLIIPLSKDHNISLYKCNVSSTELFIWQGQKMHPLLLLYKTIHIYKPQPHGRYRNIKRHGFSSRLSILRNLLRNNTACRWAVDANSIDFRYHGCSEEEDSVMPRSELAGLGGHSTHCETGHVPGVWLWSH